MHNKKNIYKKQKEFLKPAKSNTIKTVKNCKKCQKRERKRKTIFYRNG